MNSTQWALELLSSVSYRAVGLRVSDTGDAHTQELLSDISAQTAVQTPLETRFTDGGGCDS